MASDRHAAARSSPGSSGSFTGHGTKTDYVQAYKWFSLANPKDNPEAERALSNVAANLTPSELAEAQRLVREWKPVQK